MIVYDNTPEKPETGKDRQKRPRRFGNFAGKSSRLLRQNLAGDGRAGKADYLKRSKEDLQPSEGEKYLYGVGEAGNRQDLRNRREKLCRRHSRGMIKNKYAVLSSAAWRIKVKMPGISPTL